MKRVGKGRTSYRTLAARNKAAIDAYNRHNLFVLSLMGALMMLIPIASAPYSTSKRSLLPVYIVLMVCILLLTVVSRVPSFERFTLIGLYVGFSVFFALAVYLSVFNSPHMRATILIGVFCIVHDSLRKSAPTHQPESIAAMPCADTPDRYYASVD